MSLAGDFCPHVEPGAWPFDVALTLDEHLGPTDVLVTCRYCHQTYLLEMLDWQGTRRVMRVSLVDAARAAGVLRDLGRGSCDLERAAAEVHHLRTATSFSRWLLLIDTRQGVLEALVALPGQTRLPGASWRDLPCDGSWVDYARSAAPEP